MRPAEQWTTNEDFWQHQSDGLAIFLSRDLSQVHRLPFEFEERLIVAKSFHIKPLLPLLERGKKFYILALSLNNIKLFLATQDNMSEIELNIRSNIEEVLWMDNPQRHLEYHTASNMSGERQGHAGTAIFHGQSVADEEKTNILRFFHYVNQGLNELWEDKTIPMILAGVEYLLPIYRQVNSYRHLLKEEITGSPERQSPEELHRQAWKIVKPIFEAAQQQAADKFEQLHGQQSELATNDLKTTLKAATFRDIETLFVPLDRQKWGRYDLEHDRLKLVSEPKPEDQELLNFAATQTLLNAGRVFAVPQTEIPGNGELAATLRYALE